jgi:hypothetical protein
LTILESESGEMGILCARALWASERKKENLVIAPTHRAQVSDRQDSDAQMYFKYNKADNYFILGKI